MFVLGIETSCDDTAAGVVGPDGVVSDVVHGQAIHEEYGGVVPELASRAHAEKVVITARAALEQAGIERPDGVCATSGPGLVGAVLVGLNFARGLALSWDLPFVGVNHLEGHLLSTLLEHEAPEWPFLSLVVSGGHSTLYLARSLGRYEILGQTVDDAVGEAYDKVARMMRLGYPGGPPLDRLARDGRADAIAFPRPVLKPGARQSRRRVQLERRPLDMSFSGLKTAVRVHIQSEGRLSDADIAASFQEAVVDVLCDRVRRAVEQTGVRRVAIGGGVAANSRLRQRLAELPIELFLPPPARCTDNGSMIAHVGRLRMLDGQRDPWSLTARAHWVPGEQ
jgi:N6-L-threonylcarbamoyladenine synthase